MKYKCISKVIYNQPCGHACEVDTPFKPIACLKALVFEEWEAEEEHRRTAEEEAQIKSFNKLVPEAAALHTWTWCVKNQMKRHTANLRGEECLQCSHHVMNEGICDPL